jgi:hypothetical protein
MKNFIKNRYWLHLVFFFFLGYVSIYWADFKDFILIDKIVGAVSLAIAVGLGFGGAIEWVQAKLVRLFFSDANTFDYFDIFWSAIGVSLGCILYYIYQNETLKEFSIVMVLTGIVYEFTRMALVFGQEYLKRKKSK